MLRPKVVAAEAEGAQNWLAEEVVEGVQQVQLLEEEGAGAAEEGQNWPELGVVEVEAEAEHSMPLEEEEQAWKQEAEVEVVRPDSWPVEEGAWQMGRLHEEPWGEVEVVLLDLLRAAEVEEELLVQGCDSGELVERIPSFLLGKGAQPRI